MIIRTCLSLHVIQYEMGHSSIHELFNYSCLLVIVYFFIKELFFNYCGVHEDEIKNKKRFFDVHDKNN